MTESTLPLCDVLWPAAWRLVPSQYPPVNVFEDYYESAEELAVAFALEAHTNPRLLNDAGNINQLSRDEWVWGPGATWLMAPFTHLPLPSRFTDGSFGVYYAADSLEAAIAETRFHRERLLRASRAPSIRLIMRVLKNQVTKPCHDLRGATYTPYLSADIVNYPRSQALAAGIRRNGSWGLLYPSVRHPGGQCVAVFRPRALTLPIEAGYLEYTWSGQQQEMAGVRKLDTGV